MIPIAIVAHPERQRQATKLADEVKADAVFWDYHGRGGADNHLKAWRFLANSSSTHGVVLEDDVELAPNFRNQLAAAILNAPTDIVSLYLGRGRPPQVQEKIARQISNDVSYLISTALFSAQGYAMKTSLFGKHKEVEGWLRATHRNIDRSVSMAMGGQISYCRPSLVDHLDGPSLIEDHGDVRDGKTALWTEDCDPSGKDAPEIRKAWLFANRPNIDWTKGSLTL